MTRTRDTAASKAMRLQEKADRLSVEGKYAKSELLSSKADSLWRLIRKTNRSGVVLATSSHLSYEEETPKVVLSSIPRPEVATAYIPGMSEAYNASLSLFIAGASDLVSLSKSAPSFAAIPDLDDSVFVLPHR